MHPYTIKYNLTEIWLHSRKHENVENEGFPPPRIWISKETPRRGKHPLASHSSTETKTVIALNSTTLSECFSKKGGWWALTTGSGHPQWPGCDPSCSLKLRRPSRQRQPAGRWPVPAWQQGCLPASAAPMAAAPGSGWAACPRCLCEEHTRCGFKDLLAQVERQCKVLIQKESRGE